MDSVELHTGPISRYPAALQLSAGALGTGLAFVFACPAIGVASLGALADSERYARSSEALGLRWASLAVAALTIAAIALALIEPDNVPGWGVIVAGMLGLIVNALCVVAAFPLRLSQLADAGSGTSRSGFAVLIAIGLLLVIRPAAWVCVAGAVAIAIAIGWAHLTRPREAR